LFNRGKKREVNNERIKQMASSALWSELSLISSVDQTVQQILYLLTFYSMFCPWKLLLVLLLLKTMLIFFFYSLLLCHQI